MAEEIIYGKSRLFRQAIETVDAYAGAPWPVLILGETGVGKDLLARRVHARSPRRSYPFVPINCGAMPAALFESELFGHERGAFSGAAQASRGLLRAANGGTIFLDEIGDLDLSLQVKLLRFLDSGELRPVGAHRLEHADVRVCAATNRDLFAAVRRGVFRQDLLERLGVLTLQVPALRERPEDIPLLASQWLQAIACRFEIADIEPLTRYAWPGNVRQLRNFLVRASVRGGGRLSEPLVRSLLEEERSRGERVAGGGEWDSLSAGSLADIEKQVILYRLRRCRGNRKRAAEELGIAKSTLHEKLRRWREEPDSTAPDEPLGRDLGSRGEAAAATVGDYASDRLALCP
jgi:transcriptional regulator with PAS, ATPase and Fis domain